MTKFNKFNILKNLQEVQRDIFESEELLKEPSYPRERLYHVRVELDGIINYLIKHPEYLPM